MDSKVHAETKQVKLLDINTYLTQKLCYKSFNFNFQQTNQRKTLKIIPANQEDVIIIDNDTK
ncbi:TPA: hypothetical protein HMQ08_23440 [Escherichia coli]|nr:hypothetical protein CJU68_18020 [Escherichia coli]HAJ2553586.1 hypothetical protein [Escherichia coli]